MNKRINVLNELMVLLANKKDIKIRVKNGENLRAVAYEKGLKIVLPL